MATQLEFQDPQVQSALENFSEYVLTSNFRTRIVHQITRVIDLAEYCEHPKQKIANLKEALGAEALFAVWRQPLSNTEGNLNLIVKVDGDGRIIDGSPVHVGILVDDHPQMTCFGFTPDELRVVEYFALAQDQLPWQPNTSGLIYHSR
ncbi:MAG TPA: hypothetical protein VMR34_02655 [Candidatus Saccharimonadales bacterium]|nr:hypothetical protein [Candidatus Saccharimonadales bacterium]